IRQPSPNANSVLDIAAPDAQVIPDDRLTEFIGDRPADYSFNNALIKADGAQRAGNLGQNAVVAVIDSGTANSPVVPALTGTVIGGESLVPAATDPVLSPTSRRNGPHGTWVGTVIAGHANFLFANTSTLVRSLRIHAPDSVIACTPALGCPATASIVPMIGVAPAAKIYALKVFPSNTDSAPSSRIIAAMDRAITLRRNFNRGMPPVPVSGDGSEDNPFVFNSLKIDVVNMSLGGATFFAGRELDELLTLKMLAVGIAPAISAGNEGFGAMTAAGPGDGVGALGVAAANDAAHERVLRDLQFGVGIGVLYRPTTHTQTAFFSSRGPTADGRFKPDVIANGFATFAQGTCQGAAACIAGTAGAGISLVSGTSFSAPTAAGALALLRNAFPSAFAINLRNALIASANPTVLGDQSTRIDQGRGHLDVAAALAQLESGRRSFALDFSFPDDRVRKNIKELGFRTVPFVNGQFSTHVSNLVPGQVAQFFVDTDIDDKLTVTFSNITPENAAASQNQLFGDDLVVTILDAVTSTNAELLEQTFIATDKTFTATASPGLVRVSILGDWTNAGRVSADVSITREHVDRGRKTAEGTVAEGQTITVPFVVPAGAKQLDVELSWKVDWSRYPTNDLDLVLQDPAAQQNVAGATANSPERVSIAKPTAGAWQALISGFTINADADSDDHGHEFGPRHVKRDDFELRVTIDGVRVVLPRNRKGNGGHDDR
ncbi:MAG TPA: S8 family serine peptidase, partial [Vicinamibacterales bacterium]|nr:S8 family serine peptidase [Vicinamibacterales bacterium]